jgi:hypothetical protein
MRDMDGFDADAIAKAMVQSAEMDETVDYLARGRSHRLLELDQLRAVWVSAFKDWAHSLGVANSRGLGELWAEFRLRDIEPPFDQVRDEQRILVEEVQKHGPTTKESDKQSRAFWTSLISQNIDRGPWSLETSRAPLSCRPRHPQ